MVVAYLDFGKAFGTVSHDGLVGNSGSTGWTSEQWVDESLNGRAQRVMISGTESSWRHVASGVLQRLELSPIL